MYSDDETDRKINKFLHCKLKTSMINAGSYQKIMYLCRQ